MTPLPRTSTFKSHLPQPQRPSPLRGRAIAYGARSARCSPLPRAGGGLGWGRRRFTSTRSSHERTTPTPTLPQLGGGGEAVRFLICDCPAPQGGKGSSLVAEGAAGERQTVA